MTAPLESVWLLALTVVAVAYAAVAIPLRHRGRWPWRRVTLWYTGMAAAGIAVVGPLANRSHDDFPAHMLGHLLLGMAAPVLLVSSAPVTMLLRALPVVDARRVVRFLATRPVRFATHIATAAVLNTGGIWLIYTTVLYRWMHESVWLGALVQIHTLLAGYLLTAAAIGIDPAPHRPSWRFRAAILVAAFAGHAILARYLYSYPPQGVPLGEAETGSQLMYYGGDLVEIIVFVMFCWQWYCSTRPRTGAFRGGSETIVASPPRLG